MLTSRHAVFVVVFAFAFSTAFLGQEQPRPAPVNSPIHVAPPPSDPLELATVATEVPDNPQARSAVIALIDRARQNADIRTAGAPPFHLRMSFTASGDVLYTGSGETEDTWVSWESSRWSAHLGDFSMARIWDHGVSFDDKTIALIPLRLQMLRDAVFWPLRAQPGAHLRTATANWQGKQVTCVLSSGPGIQAQEIIGRRWVEREYCIDPRSGLLQILSDAPGIYVVYDYTGAVDLHGHTFPRQITIFEAGKNVLEAHVDELSEAKNIAAGLLTPASDMVRQGPVLSGAMRFPQVVPLPAGAAVMQPVIVHALVGEDGKVLDAELVGDSGAELEKSALDLVKRSSYRPAQPGSQLQREAFINVKFISK
jgi:Gram-negative bacterial TonB protein C-terminal